MIPRDAKAEYAFLAEAIELQRQRSPHASTEARAIGELVAPIMADITKRVEKAA